MPSQIYVLLGVADENATLDGYGWPIAESLVSLDAAVQATTCNGSSSPVLITCFQEEALRAVAARPGTIIGDLESGLQLSYSKGINVQTCKSECLAAEATFFIRSGGVAAVEEGETLVVILCGHGDSNGAFSAGRDLLTKKALEATIYRCKGKVVVIYTASINCAHWVSEEWELVAAVEESESGLYYRDSDALPYHDSEWRFVDELVTKMNAFRLTSNRPLLQSGIFPISAKPEEEPEDTPWTASDNEEMFQLSTAIQRQSLRPVAPNVHILLFSLWYLAGGDKREFLRSIKHKEPLVSLRKHEALRERARGIAQMMEWDTSIDPLMVDGPFNRALIREACEMGGCDVNVVTFKDEWQEPAHWLARLWKAAGGMPVDKQKWEQAVAITNYIIN